jgi:GNAT superfamily N-acetyltransferase
MGSLMRNMTKLNIINSTFEDIDTIFSLYKIATDYQKDRFPDNIWPEFERSLVETEITENRQWKLLIDNEIACVWAITFSDPQIWEERNNDPAIYIHRIATNPKFRGQKFVTKIVEWAREYAISQNKSFIRMDTCGDNKVLINHYVNCGFDFLGINKIASSEGLPSHYHDADVCLFEIKL